MKKALLATIAASFLIVGFGAVASAQDALVRGAAGQPCFDCHPDREAADGEVLHGVIELIGCEVFEAGTERRVGRVEAVQEPGGQVVLEVREGKREILIPLPLCSRIDAGAKRIEAEMPEGLEELNG